MTLLEEYTRQNAWRGWDNYLRLLPLDENQIVYDLGCAVGCLSKLLAVKVKKVIGFDSDRSLLENARENSPANCEFRLVDLSALNPNELEKCDGIWMSFTLAYMEDPASFLSTWTECLNDGGWIAIADIDGMFSNHIPESSRYYDDILSFEAAQETSKLYDFRIGRKIRTLMEQCGLKIIVAEENWFDYELNFEGKAAPNIAESWKARLERMVTIKTYFGNQYPDFCDYFIGQLLDETHKATGAVKYYVGIKG